MAVPLKIKKLREGWQDAASDYRVALEYRDTLKEGLRFAEDRLEKAYQKEMEILKEIWTECNEAAYRQVTTSASSQGVN